EVCIFTEEETQQRGAESRIRAVSLSEQPATDSTDLGTREYPIPEAPWGDHHPASWTRASAPTSE
ncbi:hypothetical protein NDU88_005116, partial [Pleurodeles waltl]